MKRIAVMLSGSGSTYAAIATAVAEGRIADAEIVRVISSKAQAQGVQRAKANGHPVTVVDVKDPQHHQAIDRRLLEDEVDLVVMAGYMHLWKLHPDLEGRVINVHPSLIPAFSGQGMYGMRVHRSVIEKGVKFSGCTVHLVDPEYDNGRILDQRIVPVECSDSADTLAAKVQAVEKSLLVNVIHRWETYR